MKLHFLIHFKAFNLSISCYEVLVLSIGVGFKRCEQSGTSILEVLSRRSDRSEVCEEFLLLPCDFFRQSNIVSDAITSAHIDLSYFSYVKTQYIVLANSILPLNTIY